MPQQLININDLSDEEMRLEHVEFWGWLSDHPGSTKQHWPGWTKYSEYPTHMCFICEWMRRRYSLKRNTEGTMRYLQCAEVCATHIDWETRHMDGRRRTWLVADYEAHDRVPGCMSCLSDYRIWMRYGAKTSNNALFGSISRDAAIAIQNKWPTE